MEGTWFGLVGFVAAATAFAFAIFLWRTRPDAATNRRLAMVLTFEGIFSVFLGLIVLLYPPNARGSVTGTVVAAGFGLTSALIPWFYLLFLGTLRTPWVAPFRTRYAHTVVLAGIIAMTVVGTLRRLLEPTAEQVVGVLLGPGAYALVSFYALGASISAWRRAQRGTAERDQARAFAVAFGVRDLLYGALFVAVVWSVLRGARAGAVPIPGWPYIAPPVILLIYVPLVAYGILKWQLFDIDLKIKVTLKRSTVAAVFVAVFFAVSEGAALFFEDRTGNAVLGILGAALLLIIINPLTRLAERVSDAAMPGTRRSSEYLVYRKFQVYQATLERGLADGVVRDKERAMLDELRRELGIADEDAERLEHETRRLLATTRA